MSWKSLVATVSAAGLAFCVMGAMPASAESDSEFGRSGPYIGGGGLYVFENFSGSAGSPSPDGSWGYNLRAGYRFNGYFALEAAWEQFVGFDHSTGDTGLWMAGVNGKFFPFDGIVQPYLSAGAGWNSVNDNRAASSRDTSGMGFQFAIGLEVYVARNWALTTEVGYLVPTSGRSDYQAIPLSFGAMYRFY